MLISHIYKFIFTKTFKTASTSIEAYFEQFCLYESDLDYSKNRFISEFRDQHVSSAGIIGFRGERDERLKKSPEWFHHMSASEIRNKIGDEIWNDYFKFCVIRNPYEKILSSFFHFYVFRNKLNYLNKNELITLFRGWIKDTNSIRVDRDKYFIKDSFVMNDIIRYENLYDDLKNICQIIGTPYVPEKLPFFKNEFRKSDIEILEFYDRYTEELVYEKYFMEFKLFSYNRLEIF